MHVEISITSYRRVEIFFQGYVKLEKAVGKNEKLESFKLESLKLERSEPIEVGKNLVKLKEPNEVGKNRTKLESFVEVGKCRQNFATSARTFQLQLELSNSGWNIPTSIFPVFSMLALIWCPLYIFFVISRLLQ